jgi:predicted ATPase
LQELERSVLRHDPSLAPPTVDRPATGRLPVPPTPLVGRRLESAAVVSLLSSEARLVTLVGPGGTGKTRLALAVAEELAPVFAGGAVFVDLSGVFEADLFLPTVAGSLGVADTGATLLEALSDQLRDRALLLVLDNLEQIPAAAPVVADLLAAAAHLRVLATSRAPLRVSGEHQYPVQPLPLPRPGVTDVDQLAQNEAMQLFVLRARAVDPSFALDETSAASVAAICRSLDGLPLALELAAARVNVLPPATMLERLEERPESLGSGPRDLPARQSTLAATIRWSYDLLAEPEREAFSRLGVFAGGCTIEAAERVCDVDLDALEALVDSSLVQSRAGRFTMLETVRRNALDGLGERDRATTRHRHAEYFVALAETAQAELETSPQPADVLDRVEADHDNIRAALGWTLDTGAPDLALRLAGSLRTFWDVRGHLGEGRRWLDVAIAAAPPAPTREYWQAVTVSAALAFHAGDLDDARVRYERVLEIALELGDADAIARAYSDLGTIAAAVEDLERASELLGEAADRFRAIGERRRLAIVLGNIGHLAAQRDDYETAIEVTAEALAIQQELGDRLNSCVSLLNLGTSALETDDHAGAREWLRECFSLAVELRYKEVLAYALAALVRMHEAEGDHVGAARLSGALATVLAESGVGLLAKPMALFEEARDAARTALGDDEYERARAEGESEPIEDALATVGMA